MLTFLLAIILARLSPEQDKYKMCFGKVCLTLLLLLLLSCFSRVRLCATPWTAAHQAPPSMGFSRQEYWSGLPLPSPCLTLPTPKNLPKQSICYQDCKYVFSLGTESNGDRKAVYVWKQRTDLEIRKKKKSQWHRQVLRVPSRKILIFPKRKVIHNSWVTITTQTESNFHLPPHLTLPTLRKTHTGLLASWTCPALKASPLHQSFSSCFLFSWRHSFLSSQQIHPTHSSWPTSLFC